MLSVEELGVLLEMEGEEIWEIRFKNCKAGDVFLAKSESGDVYLFELTVPISRRANIYEIKKGDLASGSIFYGSHHIIFPVRITESTSFGEEHVGRLFKLKKVKSG